MRIHRSLCLCAAIIFGITGAIAAAATAATATEYQEGVHYLKLPVAVETRDPAKIEVVEVFSYGCIHCYRLEPTLDAWARTQGDDVDFHRVPFAAGQPTLAQAFYTAETLGVLGRVHMPIFAAIHDYGINMTQPGHIRRLFVRDADVNEEEFQRVFDSFGILSRVKQADAKSRMYRLWGTPTMVVNGRYTVDLGTVGSNEAMLLVVNHLVAMERKAAKR